MINGGACLGCYVRQPIRLQNFIFRSRDWLSANQEPVFPDSVGSWSQQQLPILPNFPLYFQELPILPQLLFVHLHCQLSRLTYLPSCVQVVPIKRTSAESLDPHIYNTGLATIFRQVDSMIQWITAMNQCFSRSKGEYYWYLINNNISPFLSSLQTTAWSFQICVPNTLALLPPLPPFQLTCWKNSAGSVIFLLRLPVILSPIVYSKQPNLN